MYILLAYMFYCVIFYTQLKFIFFHFFFIGNTETIEKQNITKLNKRIKDMLQNSKKYIFNHTYCI